MINKGSHVWGYQEQVLYQSRRFSQCWCMMQNDNQFSNFNTTNELGSCLIFTPHHFFRSFSLAAVVLAFKLLLVSVLISWCFSTHDQANSISLTNERRWHWWCWWHIWREATSWEWGACPSYWMPGSVLSNKTCPGFKKIAGPRMLRIFPAICQIHWIWLTTLRS